MRWISRMMTRMNWIQLAHFFLFASIPFGTSAADLNLEDEATKSLQQLKEDSFTAELVVERATYKRLGRNGIWKAIGRSVSDIKLSGDLIIERVTDRSRDEATGEGEVTFLFKKGITIFYQPRKRLAVVAHATHRDPLLLLAGGGRRVLGGKVFSRNKSILPLLAELTAHEPISYHKEKYKNHLSLRTVYDISRTEEDETLEVIILPEYYQAIGQWTVRDQHGRIKMRYSGSEFKVISSHSGSPYWIPTITEFEEYTYSGHSQVSVSRVEMKVVSMSQPDFIPLNDFDIQYAPGTVVQDVNIKASFVISGEMLPADLDDLLLDDALNDTKLPELQYESSSGIRVFKDRPQLDTGNIAAEKEDEDTLEFGMSGSQSQGSQNGLNVWTIVIALVTIIAGVVLAIAYVKRLHARFLKR